MNTSDQLQLVTIGLQGSGKTTTCVCLEQLLGGKWLNQDEFSHLGKRAKDSFLKVLTEETRSSSTRPIIVDRINTTKNHRFDVFSSMSTIGRRVVVLWDITVKDCIYRVKGRKFGHKSILPKDNAAMIVSHTKKQQEPLSNEEISLYHIQKVIMIQNAMELSREQVVKLVLDGLHEFKPELALISDENIAEALKICRLREVAISHANMKRTGSVQNLLLVKEGRYEITLHSSVRFQEYFGFFNDDCRFRCKDEFHITLLFIKKNLARLINGDDHEEPQSHSVSSTPFSTITNSGMYSTEEYRRALLQYETLRNATISVRVKYIAKNQRVMALKVEFITEQLMNFDVIPHISIAKIPEAEFREANQLITHVDGLKLSGTQGISDDGSTSWIDFEEQHILTGVINFRRHGS